MGDILADASTWLADKLASHAAGEVEYRRGNDAYTVSAAKGQTEYETTDDYGLVLAAETRDFLIAADAFPEGLVEPQAGDRIVAGGVVYEVLDLAGQGAWRWTDAHRTMLRIHTREVGME